MGDIPSGPGAVRGAICLSTAQTSYAWNSRPKQPVASSKIAGWIPCKILSKSDGLEEVKMERKILLKSLYQISLSCQQLYSMSTF